MLTLFCVTCYSIFLLMHIFLVLITIYIHNYAFVSMYDQYNYFFANLQ